MNSAIIFCYRIEWTWCHSDREARADRGIEDVNANRLKFATFSTLCHTCDVIFVLMRFRTSNFQQNTRNFEDLNTRGRPWLSLTCIPKRIFLFAIKDLITETMKTFCVVFSATFIIKLTRAKCTTKFRTTTSVFSSVCFLRNLLYFSLTFDKKI